VEEARLTDVDTSRRYRQRDSWTTCESNRLDLDIRTDELVRSQAMRVSIDATQLELSPRKQRRPKPKEKARTQNTAEAFP
jgi:hypothetical protein